MGIMIISTYPNKKSVSVISNIVVKKGLAACVNYTKINSVYEWRKRIEKTEEFLAIFKTTTKSKELLKKEIAKTHPYEVPEVVEIKMNSVNKSYRDWLMASTGKGKPKRRDHASKRRDS